MTPADQHLCTPGTHVIHIAYGPGTVVTWAEMVAHGVVDAEPTDAVLIRLDDPARLGRLDRPQGHFRANPANITVSPQPLHPDLCITDDL